jgi:DNA-binding transcriptional LysR family regulator
MEEGVPIAACSRQLCVAVRYGMNCIDLSWVDKRSLLAFTVPIIGSMDKFEAIKVFVGVVDAGSFVGAAENLNLSKTAVSRQVADLESALGVRLLHRTTRKLSLTEAGQTFHIRCKSLLADLAQYEGEVAAQAVRATGILKINVPVTFGLLHLAPLWPSFMEMHPGVTLDVTLSDRVVDLVEEGYDMAVRIARLPSSTLISRQLASTRMVLCASPTYLERNGYPTEPAELRRHRVLSYSLFSMGDQWSFLGPQGELSVNVSPVLRTNSGDTCRQAAVQGQGVILQPSFLVADDIRSGALQELMPAYRALSLDICAVYPTRQLVPQKVRVMIDHLADALRSPSWSI